MKRLLTILVCFVLVVSAFASLQVPTAFARGEYAVLKFSGEQQSNNILKINVTLETNPGVNMANFRLMYDRNVLTFVNFELQSGALPQMSVITSISGDTYSESMFSGTEAKLAEWNRRVDSGEVISPPFDDGSGRGDASGFYFSYEGKNEDYYTGKIATLYFKVKEGANAFTTNVYYSTLDFDKVDSRTNTQMQYTCYCDYAQINYKPGQEIVIVTKADEDKPTNTAQVLLIVGLSVLAGGLLTTLVLLIIKRINHRHLTKIK